MYLRRTEGNKERMTKILKSCLIALYNSGFLHCDTWYSSALRLPFCLISHFQILYKLLKPAECVLEGKAQHIQRVQSLCVWRPTPVELILAPLCGRWNLSNFVGNRCVACCDERWRGKSVVCNNMVTCLPLSHELWTLGCLVRNWLSGPGRVGVWGRSPFWLI